MSWLHTEGQPVPNMPWMAGESLRTPRSSEILLCQVLNPPVSEKLDPPLVGLD